MLELLSFQGGALWGWEAIPYSKSFILGPNRLLMLYTACVHIPFNPKMKWTHCKVHLSSRYQETHICTLSLCQNQTLCWWLTPTTITENMYLKTPCCKEWNKKDSIAKLNRCRIFSLRLKVKDCEFVRQFRMNVECVRCKDFLWSHWAVQQI